MSAPSTSGLSVELLLRVIDVKYGCFTLLYFLLLLFSVIREFGASTSICGQVWLSYFCTREKN